MRGCQTEGYRHWRVYILSVYVDTFDKPLKSGTDMSKAPVVSVIVVSYNTRDMTLEAIRSAREQTKALCEFIVVDNASEDG
ncbi:MAG: glycosyltransferase, partial [Pseudomonadota bacterium]